MMAIGKTIYDADRASQIIQMEVSIMVIGTMINLMAMDKDYGQMEMTTQDSLKTAKWKIKKVNLPGKIRTDILEDFKMGKNMAKESKLA